MAFLPGTSGGGSETSVRDWDYIYFAQGTGSNYTWNLGYKPKKVIISFAYGGSRLVKMYDEKTDTDYFTAYSGNTKSTQPITDTAFRIVDNGVSINPFATQWTAISIWASPD